MTYSTLLIPIIGLALILWQQHHYRRLVPSHVQAVEAFLQRTGFRVSGLDHQPLADQAAAAVVPAQGTPRPYFLDLDIGRLTYYHSPRLQGETWGAPLGCSGWVLHLRQPLGWNFRLVGPDLDDETPTPKWRAQGHLLDVRGFGLAKHLAHSTDPAALLAVLQTSGLRQKLTELADLQFYGVGDHLVLVDFQSQNLVRESGGTVAQMLAGTSVSRQMDLAAMAHERIIDLFVQWVTAARARG